MIRALLAIATALFAGGCCIALPKGASKRQPFPRTPAASHAIEESAAVWRDERRSRDVPVRIYAPRDVGKRPVVVFSHGIGEDRDSYVWLGRALAARGFLTVHVTHAGTDKAVLKQGYRKLYQATKNVENWRNRPRDVSFVLDRLAARPDADLERVAVVGHSAGAFTAFAVAGFRATTGETLVDPRVKVIVPMSMPKIAGFYDTIAVPVLNVTGTCDTSLVYRTYPRDRRVPFEQATAPRQYLVTIQRANHNTFSNAEDRFHPLLVELTSAFLQAYLAEDAAARAWFDEAGRWERDDVTLSVERK